MGFFARLRQQMLDTVYAVVHHDIVTAGTLNYRILEMRERLENAREMMATTLAAECRLAMQAEDAARATEQWAQRAWRAVEYGEDELAREALRRKCTAEKLTAFYQRAHARRLHAVVGVRNAVKRLESRLLEMKTKRTHMLAHLAAVRATRIIARSPRQTIGAEAFETFDRIAFEADTKLRQALALTELVDDLDESFVVSERDHAVEIALASLKRQLRGNARKHTPTAAEKQGES